MRISFTDPEIQALRQAAGEAAAGEMETWTHPQAKALSSAHTKLDRAAEQTRAATRRRANRDLDGSAG